MKPNNSDWEKRFDKKFGGLIAYGYGGTSDKNVSEEVKSFISSVEKEAVKKEYQFFLNILEGVDQADKEMGGGGTKAIRFALRSRYLGDSPTQSKPGKVV